MRFWLLGSRLAWYGVHFRDQRPTPCLASVGRCAECEEGWLPRPVAYIAALRCTTGGRYLLRISEYAARNNPALLAQFAWRGALVEVRRRAAGRNAPWVVDLPKPDGPPPELPRDVDVTAVLSLVWGVNLRRVAESPPPDGDITPFLRPYNREKGGRR